MNATPLQKKLLERDKKQREENARKLFSESLETKVLGFSETVGSLKTQDIMKDQFMMLDAHPASSLASTMPLSAQLDWAKEQLAHLGSATDISVYMPLAFKTPIGQWTRLITKNPSCLAAAAIVDGIVAVDEKTGKACIIKVKENDLQSIFRKYKI